MSKRTDSVPENALLRENEQLRARLHQCEQLLIASEERFQMLAAGEPQVYWSLELEPEQILRVSPGFERVFGMPPNGGDANPRVWLASIHPEDRADVRKRIARCIRGEISEVTAQYRTVQPDGGIRSIKIHGTVARTKNGRPGKLIGIAKDITAELAFALEKIGAEEAKTFMTGEVIAMKDPKGTVKETEDVLRALGNNLPDGAIFQFVRGADRRGRYTYFSETIERLIGIPAPLVLKDPSVISATIHPDDAPCLKEARRHARQTLSDIDIENRIITATGEIRWMHWRAAPRQMPNGDTLWNGVLTEVTKRKASEQALQRANRALLVHRECAESMARATSEPELLNRICQIVLKLEGVRMAWVGFADQDEKKTVRPVAWAGNDAEAYLSHTRISWANSLRGRGPTGTAIRTREVNACRDIHADSRMTPWKSRQRKHGYATSVALPLLWEDQCLGSLTIYSTQIDAFNDQEVDFLKELAGDLTYGLIALRTRAEREQLQQELLKISEREKQLIAQELHDGLCQHLAGTALMGSLLQRRLAAKGSDEAQSAAEICDLLNTGVNEARNLAHGLHPVKAESDGLSEALSQLAQTVTRLFHIRCLFRCASQVEIGSQPVATHLFRIAQEAINNAMKHGQASQILITLKKANERIILSIRDNGCGMPNELPRTGGMGLQIMKHRATTIGASLAVRSAGKTGTVVVCTVRA